MMRTQSSMRVGGAGVGVWVCSCSAMDAMLDAVASLVNLRSGRAEGAKISLMRSRVAVHSVGTESFVKMVFSCRPVRANLVGW